jgi:hypothetical protein
MHQNLRCNQMVGFSDPTPKTALFFSSMCPSPSGKRSTVLLGLFGPFFEHSSYRFPPIWQYIREIAKQPAPFFAISSSFYTRNFLHGRLSPSERGDGGRVSNQTKTTKSKRLSCVRHTKANMKTRIIIIILFCLIVSIFVSGCATIGNVGVAGTYISNQNATLVLNSDGTYIQGTTMRKETGTYYVSGDDLAMCMGSTDPCQGQIVSVPFYKISGSKLLYPSGGVAYIKQ